jgi:ribonucleoside-diphosphate reductase alpha chain
VHPSDTWGPASALESTAPPANGGAATAPSASFTDSPPVVPAKLRGFDLGPACTQCGGMMQRTGSCYTCPSCGNNTGCG